MVLTGPIRSVSIPAGLHRIHGNLGRVSCHVLVENGRAVIIDTGLAGERGRFQRLFARLGLEATCVEAILLTHGHLDHAGNLAWLKAWTGAPILAHPSEQAHIDGVFPYRGVARVCGALEAAGRLVFRYRPARIDRALADGDELPWWGGLRVVHLPGHTLGHCGFWSEFHRLLFVGDLVAIWTWRTTFPPPIFNSAPELMRESLRRAAALHPRLVVANHYSRFDPAWMAERLAAFAVRKG
jgi:glyoxylase-like metal-dependent hydrolase (beta-lactamase superfamily II)